MVDKSKNQRSKIQKLESRVRERPASVDAQIAEDAGFGIDGDVEGTE
jgi:hypothetical protein